MATIALYENKINQLPTLITDVMNSVSGYSSELFSLKQKSLNVASNVCNLDDVIQSIQSSTDTQEKKSANLKAFQQKSEDFISEVDRIDSDVAAIVNQNKDDFYGQYYYLKPECEKTGWEKVGDGLASAAEWCKEHWKEIVLTVVIVILAVLAIAAVIATGGVALAPLLAGILGYFGVAAGTALTIATYISLGVAVVAITSTVLSSIVNIMDIWGDFDNNSGFQTFKTAMNWTSMITNGIYGIGGIYNAFHGIANSSLKAYGNSWLKSWLAKDGVNGFVSTIKNADGFVLNFAPNTSTFWAGLSGNGENIAAAFATKNGVSTLGQVLPDVLRPTTDAGWGQASASMAMSSSGDATALIGNGLGQVTSTGKVIGSNWTNIESILLNINPKVTSLTLINNYGTASKSVTFIARTFQLPSLLQGILGFGQSTIDGKELSED